MPLLAINAEDDPVRPLSSIDFSSADTHQIAVNEAIPYQEFGQNPYTVLCTTSLGGHLSWFESNGERWFAKPVDIPGNRLQDKVPLTNIGLPISRTPGQGYRL